MTERAPLLADDLVQGVLAEGRQAYVAVAAAHGPHVTPVLYGYDQHRLAFFAADGTFKARVLRRRPQAGILVQAPHRSIVLGGEVTPIDPIRPWEVLAGLATQRVDRMVASHALRNAGDLVAFGSDYVRGRLGFRPPGRRALFVVRPRWAMVLEGWRVVEVLGRTGPSSAVADSGGADVGPQPGGAAVVGLNGEVPLAVPARWDAERSVARVPAAVLERVGVTGSGLVAVVADEYRRPGPAAKEGILLRGDGSARRTGGIVRIRVTPHRASAWRGAATETVHLAEA